MEIDWSMNENILPLSRYEQYRKALENELKEVFSSREGFLYDVLRYHFGWTDQRGEPKDSELPLHFQPTLALACCEALSGEFQTALPAAVAIELVHNFTLVHGEVQSGRMEAQDRPSIWWVWGPAQAINAGDGLHALGRTSMMRLAHRDVPAERVLIAIESLDRACLTLCEGQYMDLDFQDQPMVTFSAYYDMIARKTGALAGCSAESGALAAGADLATGARFRDMGNRLGMAWQISQDIADLWGQRGDGMTSANALNKKKSLPLIFALENAGVAIKRELAAIYMKRVLQPQDVSRVVEILDQAEARQFAEVKAEELVGQAFGALAEAGIPAQRLEGLRHLGQWALDDRG